MKFVYLSLSRQVGDGVPYGYHYMHTEKPKVPPTSGTSWGPVIMRRLADRGHETSWIGFETRDYINGYFLEETLAGFTPAPRCHIVYTHDRDAVRPLIDDAEVILLRHHYRGYRHLLDGVDLERKSVVQILAGVARTLLYQPRCPQYHLLVNANDELAHYRAQGVAADIFLKPAGLEFYETPERVVEKRYDLASILWDSSRPRKRAGLLLDALAPLDQRLGRPVRLALAGDWSAYRDAIDRSNATLARVTIVPIGTVQRREAVQFFRESRVTIVTSGPDANPQVISESLACNVPVALAADISGGSFQISIHTGELFAPDPVALATTLDMMLNNVNRYAPRAHCVTVDMAVDQIEHIVRQHA